ncbi:ATPase family AAA domain-containing protein 3B [Colletotrichum sidae]|uniref:ATPase family AAA domain-containing protein 3B n=1 Tax=Colletotrichum sidae TaxID=1347389 RepID=A0A4R8TFJ6_9PEZI|nr:ATPase family AAA domain-containing protein 3B [Colletotrichum sidae]
MTSTDDPNAAMGTTDPLTSASINDLPSLNPPEQEHVSNEVPAQRMAAPSELGSTARPGIPANISGSASVAEELRALKEKISQLESSSQQHGPDAGPAPRPPRPDWEQEMERYRRLEKCIYGHMKEREKEANVGQFGMAPTQSNWPGDSEVPRGPWAYHWKPTYPFPRFDGSKYLDPAHDCGKDETHSEVEKIVKDEHDHAIDFTGRRNRIRKAFEWEMERLYLVEETAIRKRKQVELEKVRNSDGGKKKEKDQANEAAENRPVLEVGDWYTFCRLHDEEAVGDAFSLHILMGEPVVEDWEITRDWLGTSSRRTRKGATQSSQAFDQDQFPERIRLSSMVVFMFLDKILKSIGNRTGLAINPEPVVFTRPFKLLTYCESALESSCDALEKQLRKGDLKNKQMQSTSASEMNPADAVEAGSVVDESPAEALDKVWTLAVVEGGDAKANVISRDENTAEKVASTQSSSGTGAGDLDTIDEPGGLLGVAEDADGGDSDAGLDDLEEVLRSPKALVELRFLLHALRTTVFKRREYLQSDSCAKVYFSDLWHLYRPGMEVISGDGKQVYRVLHVTGAPHRVVSTFDKWARTLDEDEGKKRKQPRPDFRIICTHIDFDGKRFGAVATTFDLKPFEGERDVASFDVIPLRIHLVRQEKLASSDKVASKEPAETESFRKTLINRGKTFLEAISSKHMYYAGPTLDTHENIEGQVIVDFEAAFFVEQDSKLLSQKPLIQPLANVSLEDYDDDNGCYADCCRDTFVFDDTEIDLRQGLEFIDSQTPKPGMVSSPVLTMPQSLEELRETKQDGSQLLPDDELLLLSHRLFAFVLRDRKFAQLDIEYLSEVQTRESLTQLQREVEGYGSSSNNPDTEPITAFDRLVLDEGHKSMIKSLIAQHFRDKQTKGGPHDQFDVVRGKGKGLIVLLHGAPGVGKTSTAEGSAELFGKPLFQITCGDLGTTAKEVEESLEKHFALANRWDCILLLDEADVFLAERTKEDFKRNGLVAVFLRVLEYYTGILFLTTNRVGDFDEAFTSRIHMSLYYPELDKTKTVKIFQLNLEMIEERFARKKRKIDIDQAAIGAFASEHFLQHEDARWNGRQIRNACQTALALAEFDAQGKSHKKVLNPGAKILLKVEHFETVRNAYLEFTEYMIKLHGTTAATKAGEGKIRAVFVDENNNLVDGGFGSRHRDRRAAFARQAQTPLFGGEPQQQHDGHHFHGHGYQQQPSLYPPQAHQDAQQGFRQQRTQHAYQGHDQYGGPPPATTQFPRTPPSQVSRGVPAGPDSAGFERNQPPYRPGGSFQGSQPHYAEESEHYVPSQGPGSQRFSRDTQDSYGPSNTSYARPSGYPTPSRAGPNAETSFNDQRWEQPPGEGGIGTAGPPGGLDRGPRGEQ